MLLEPETPLSRSAELDFGFPPHASLVVTYICYPELKLSTGAAGLVVQHLSCKTLLAELGRLGFWRKWSLEHVLPVSPWSCKSSKRGFSQQVRAIPGELNRTKPETPFSRSAELDFGFLPVATPAGMHTCYPELQLSTGAANSVAQYLSCKTLPETLQKHHVSPETQLRTLAIRVAPPQPGAARVLSGVSPNRLARPSRNKAPKPETLLR